MKWIIDGKWLEKSTGKIYSAKAFAITHGVEDPIEVLHDNYEGFDGMTFLGGSVTRDNEIPAALITPLKEEKQ